MQVSKQKQKQIAEEKKVAIKIYKLGYSVRATADILRKQGLNRSRSWVGEAVKGTRSLKKK